MTAKTLAVPLLLGLTACTSQNGGLNTCGQLTPCSGGRGYQFCTTGSSGGCAVGRYLQSDGQTLACASCADCQAAAVQEDAWCAGVGATDLGVAPDMSSPPILIPKTGARYTGMSFDPGLNNASDCPDFNLEPNDGPGSALVLPTPPDVPTPKVIKVAICPKGAAPWSGTHDTDWYRIDPSQAPLSLLAEVFYDISFGDLDIAIVDGGGHILASDGSAVTNGCVAGTLGSEPVYVVVAGAKGTGTNNYQILVRTFAAPHSCP